MNETYVRFCARATEIGYEAAYAEVYGESIETPKEYAKRLSEILGVREIAALLRLRYGSGSKSQVHRWLNDAAREQHNTYRRERTAKARKYARNLATRGFPLEEIEKRVGEKYRECVRSVAGWIE